MTVILFFTFLNFDVIYVQYKETIIGFFLKLSKP